MTGTEIARADWVERGYSARWEDPRGNRVNRNQIGAAKLDGKRLSILAARGTILHCTSMRGIPSAASS